MNADEFNARYPIGTPVLAYPSIRPEHPVAVAFQKRAKEGRTFGDSDPCKRLVTRTRTPAWPLGHGEPVVSVDGYAGGIVLEHVDVISEDEFEAARAAETAAAVAALGALPMPVGDQPQPLTDRQLAEVDRSWAAYQQHAPTGMACCTAHAAADHVPALQAEVQRLKGHVAELEEQRERRRLRLVALQNDALNMRGSLAPNGEERKVPFPLGETLTPAVDWLIARVAELEKAVAS